MDVLLLTSTHNAVLTHGLSMGLSQDWTHYKPEFAEQSAFPNPRFNEHSISARVETTLFLYPKSGAMARVVGPKRVLMLVYTDDTRQLRVSTAAIPIGSTQLVFQRMIRKSKK